MGAGHNIEPEVLAYCLEIHAAFGWCLLWIVGPYALAGAANMNGTNSWEFVITACNFTTVVFGWLVAAILAWVCYYRGGKTSPKCYPCSAVYDISTLQLSRQDWVFSTSSSSSSAFHMRITSRRSNLSISLRFQQVHMRWFQLSVEQ